MQTELIYGVYLFFLLVGIAFGLLVGWLIGFSTAQKDLPDWDDAYAAYERAKDPDSPHFVLEDESK